jgi:hypothetical protein
VPSRKGAERGAADISGEKRRARPAAGAQVLGLVRRRRVPADDAEGEAMLAADAPRAPRAPRAPACAAGRGVQASDPAPRARRAVQEPSCPENPFGSMAMPDLPYPEVSVTWKRTGGRRTTPAREPPRAAQPARTPTPGGDG